MSRKAKRISKEEFENILKEKAYKSLKADGQVDNKEEFELEYSENYLYEAISCWTCSDSTIVKDLEKIEFDLENLFVDNNDWDGPEIGIQEINGFVFLGCVGGGDWEQPVYFILYVDNKGKLRGYIPTDGNVFNKKLKSAFGNNVKWGSDNSNGPEYDDDAAAKDQYGLDSYDKIDYDECFDWEKVKADIINRIELE